MFHLFNAVFKCKPFSSRYFELKLEEAFHLEILKRFRHFTSLNKTINLKFFIYLQKQHTILWKRL